MNYIFLLKGNKVRDQNTPASSMKIVRYPKVICDTLYLDMYIVGFCLTGINLTTIQDH